MGSTLLSSINIGRETLMGHGSAMATLSDNVSNSNTTGFKSGNTVFADMLTSGGGAIGVLEGVSGGDGSYVNDIDSNFTQGALEQTNKPYDLAVDGDGFFTLAKPDKNGDATTEYYYTRAGNFQLDAEGRLVNADGFLVMAIPEGGSSDELQPITLHGHDSVPVATTTAKISGNLDTTTPLIGAALPPVFSDNSELAKYPSFSAAVQVIDSLGQVHDLGLSFFKTGVNAQTGGVTWAVRAFANGDEVGGTLGSPVQVGSLESIEIDSTGAMVGTPNLVTTTAWSNGAQASSVAIDLSGFSGFAKESYISGTVSDGSAAGIAKALGFDDKGRVSAVLDSGVRTPIGTIALARFPNVQGLQRQGGTLYVPDETAGDVSYDAPRANGRGALQQASLESSNVDLAEQFVSVIRIQRTYQAGSQVIKTADELLNTTIQIA